MKRILVAILLISAVASLIGSAGAQNGEAYKPNYWRQGVELSVQDVPFGEALQALFRGTTASYTLPDDIAKRKISMQGTKWSRERALARMCEIMGLTPQVDGDKITFVDKQPQVAPTAAEWKDWQTAGAQSDILIFLDSHSFRNTPFPQVVSSLLDPLKVNYTVSPGLEQAKVTAVLNNLSVDDALSQVTRAAGATYSVQASSNGVANYIFSPSVVTQNQVFSPNLQQTPIVANFAQTTRNQIDESNLGPGHPDYRTYETISLKYVDASAVLPLAALEPDLLIAKTGANFVTVHGRPAVIERFKDVVAAVDRQESMPRAVRVKATVEVTASEKTDGAQPEATRAETESVGIEGQRMPLTITARSVPSGPGVIMTGNGQPVDTNGRPLSRNLELHMDLTPTVMAAESSKDGKAAPTISLTGHGIISGYLPMEFSKDFDFATSLELGAKGTIAQGKVEMDNASVGFTVFISASVEKGRVQLPPNLSQGGFGGGMIGGGGDGGGPGGGFGQYGGMMGGAYGSSYGGGMMGGMGTAYGGSMGGSYGRNTYNDGSGPGGYGSSNYNNGSGPGGYGSNRAPVGGNQPPRGSNQPPTGPQQPGNPPAAPPTATPAPNTPEPPATE